MRMYVKTAHPMPTPSLTNHLHLQQKDLSRMIAEKVKIILHQLLKTSAMFLPSCSKRFSETLPNWKLNLTNGKANKNCQKGILNYLVIRWLQNGEFSCLNQSNR